ncbi:MAG: bifunctional (p)ppGpp synthetase/guanosine-3',5'-bis(diphosphate) 3'-pyrophosphohydrolase [Clostridiales bacterium]|nr:bifunctional (p)ppGpp synthetase/guanosine-3',5'-bis(diphosphate) 3'-pyrophosphohydrolase [Clostridiales bacterium]
MFNGIDKLLFILEDGGRKYDIDKISEAYEYAKEIHKGQYRKSGEEYIVHPIAVAEIVAEYSMDTDSICAAFLHDTLEDCPDKTSLEEIRIRFGNDVAELVDGLTKLVVLKSENQEDTHIESLRKMFFAMAKDVRVIMIKLADRLHNMRTLSAQPEEKRRAIALETMYVYAPLAHRLGMQRMKAELEDLSLRYLDPKGYEQVSESVNQKYGQTMGFLEKIREEIKKELTKNGIKFTLEGRVKSVYSLYNKIFVKGRSFEEIYDFYAFRIIVETNSNCYETLGIIHDLYNAIPNRLKDYISTPKPNKYQAIHTSVIGEDGIPFEVQIRTKEMNQIAEYGIAAHWKYKSGEQSQPSVDEKLEWISRLIEQEENTENPDDFYGALKIDLFQDETFVFTPKGTIITLPQNANCIDFAYKIHSEVGNHMIGAKVNGVIVPIDRKLNNGDIVEIITSSSSKGPSRDWLNIALTSEAKTKIRQWFKKEKRPENIETGKNMVVSEMRRLQLGCTTAEFNSIMEGIASRLGMGSIDDLFSMLGYGGIALDKVSSKLREEYIKVVEPDKNIITSVSQIAVVNPSKQLKGFRGVIVDGLEGCQVKFAKCCNPLPGDNILGFITKGYGISIHKRDCQNIMDLMKDQPDRFVNVSWSQSINDSSDGSNYEAFMQLFVEDRLSMLADISTALAEMKVSITQITTQKTQNNNVIVNLAVTCKNLSHFNNIMSRLKDISGIIDVKRGFGK